MPVTILQKQVHHYFIYCVMFLKSRQTKRMDFLSMEFFTCFPVSDVKYVKKCVKEVKFIVVLGDRHVRANCRIKNCQHLYKVGCLLIAELCRPFVSQKKNLVRNPQTLNFT